MPIILVKDRFQKIYHRQNIFTIGLFIPLLILWGFLERPDDIFPIFLFGVIFIILILSLLKNIYFNIDRIKIEHDNIMFFSKMKSHIIKKSEIKKIDYRNQRLIIYKKRKYKSIFLPYSNWNNYYTGIKAIADFANKNDITVGYGLKQKCTEIVKNELIKNKINYDIKNDMIVSINLSTLRRNIIRNSIRFAIPIIIWISIMLIVFPDPDIFTFSYEKYLIFPLILISLFIVIVVRAISYEKYKVCKIIINKTEKTITAYYKDGDAILIAFSCIFKIQRIFTFIFIHSFNENIVINTDVKRTNNKELMNVIRTLTTLCNSKA